jgi:hypothetical protein
VVRDGNFKNAPALPSHFGGHLRLESKAVFAELNFLQDLPSKDLVARPHVGEVQV